jgi:hypothetical protein
MIDSFSGQYEFLSNFYPCRIEDGIIYSSVEHAYQAMKSLSIAERLKVAACNTPGRAKRMGRKLELRPDWEDVKVDIMLGLLEKKFRDPELNRQLQDTGDEELIEGNTWGDIEWGVYKGKGENMLGKLLMALRETYKTEC